MGRARDASAGRFGYVPSGSSGGPRNSVGGREVPPKTLRDMATFGGTWLAISPQANVL